MVKGLPYMPYGGNIKKAYQASFGGYNHTPGASNGEIWDMGNLSSDDLPLLAPRLPRYTMRDNIPAPNGLFAMDKLCLIEGTAFYYDGIQRGLVTDGPKTMVALGARIIILPDKKLFNGTYEFKGTYATLAALEAAIPSPAYGDAYRVGDDDGNYHFNIYVWDGTAWYDNGFEFQDIETSVSAGSVTFANGLLYEEEAKCNAIISASIDWSEYFRKGDAVTISGCTNHVGNNKTAIIQSIDEPQSGTYRLNFYENIFTLDGDDGTTPYSESNVKLERKMPDLDYICENENRLWGCKGNTIWASGLGNPFCWYDFDTPGICAWSCDVGSPGEFTGCVSYKGYAIFFKEDAIYKVFGAKPTTFEVSKSSNLGVMAGSHKSLAIAGDTLFYLSRAGMIAYPGGIPEPIGAVLGERFRDAVGGSDGLKYYVSMQNQDGIRKLFIFDTEKGVWMKEDDLEVWEFAFCNRALLALCPDGEDGGRLLALGAQWPLDGVVEDAIQSYVEFGDFYNNMEKQSLIRMQLRLEIAAEASLEIFVQYNSDGAWQSVKSLAATQKVSDYLPVLLQRCDHFRVKIVGIGWYRLYSISYEVNPGSAV